MPNGFDRRSIGPLDFSHQEGYTIPPSIAIAHQAIKDGTAVNPTGHQALIIIPTYNERDNLPKIIPAALARVCLKPMCWWWMI